MTQEQAIDRVKKAIDLYQGKGGLLDKPCKVSLEGWDNYYVYLTLPEGKYAITQDLVLHPATPLGQA